MLIGYLFLCFGLLGKLLETSLTVDLLALHILFLFSRKIVIV